MSFLGSMDISGSALTAHRLRMDIISQNMAAANVTKGEDGKPYRRLQVVYKERELNFASIFNQTLKDQRGEAVAYGGVGVSQVVEDPTPFIPVYDPSHPHADEKGYIYKPNVNTAKEMADMMEATRSYNNNANVVDAVKQMAVRGLAIGK